MAKVAMMLASNQRRGAEVFGTVLADHLGRLGHEVRVVPLCPATTEPTLDVAPAGRSRRDPKMWVRAVREARKADVVFGVGSTTLIVGAIAARVARKPFVYRSIGDPAYWGQVRFADLRVGAPLRSARFVGALFPAAADYFVEHYGVDRSRLGVIPSAVDTTQFAVPTSAERTAARDSLGVSGDSLVVAYVGALSPEKAPEVALDTLAELPAGTQMVIAGDGPMGSHLQQVAVERRLPAHFLGVRSDVQNILWASDVVLLPSRTEGIPRVAIEAGLCGVPAVVTDVGGAGWVVDDGVTGRVVSGHDPSVLAAAVQDAAARRFAMGAASSERCAALFSMDAIAQKWSAAINLTMGAGGAPPRQ